MVTMATYGIDGNLPLEIIVIVGKPPHHSALRGNCAIPSEVKRQLKLITIIIAIQVPTDTSKEPLRGHYLGHVTGYQPIGGEYLLTLSVQNLYLCLPVGNIGKMIDSSPVITTLGQLTEKRLGRGVSSSAGFYLYLTCTTIHVIN